MYHNDYLLAGMKRHTGIEFKVAHRNYNKRNKWKNKEESEVGKNDTTI